MTADLRPVRRGPVERAAAWIVTGPLGHLYGGLADWMTMLTRYWWARARRRDPATGRPARKR